MGSVQDQSQVKVSKFPYQVTLSNQWREPCFFHHWPCVERYQYLLPEEKKHLSQTEFVRFIYEKLLMYFFSNHVGLSLKMSLTTMWRTVSMYTSQSNQYTYCGWANPLMLLHCNEQWVDLINYIWLPKSKSEVQVYQQVLLVWTRQLALFPLQKSQWVVIPTK